MIKFRFPLLVALLSAINLQECCLAQTSHVQWEPYQAVGTGGVTLRGEIGRMTLPVRHSKPDGQKLEIAFVRFRSDHPKPRAAIVYLAGGPGGSGIELSSYLATHPHLRLLEHADVIGIDQRGVGLSRPNLMEPEFTEDLPWNLPANRSDYNEAFQRCVDECIQYWTEKNVDLGAFNTDESSFDIERIRKELGYSKVILFGSSYGSHLGLAYLSRFESNVDRAIFTKVEGLGQTWKDPSAIQLILDQLESEYLQDADYPKGFASLHEAIVLAREKLQNDQIEVSIEDENGVEKSIVLSEYELMMAVSNWMTDTEGIAKLPSRLAKLLVDDWSDLAEFATKNRQVSIQAMPLFMDCASGASIDRQRKMEAERVSPDNLLQDGLSAPFFIDSCQSCGEIDLGESFRNGIVCHAPVLFVSGTLDVRTPPSNVEQMLSNYPNSAHVVVRNASHDSRELMSSEYRRLVQGFLRGEAVSSCEFVLPRIRFEAPRPNLQPRE